MSLGSQSFSFAGFAALIIMVLHIAALALFSGPIIA
jgi:hypothetical protein